MATDKPGQTSLIETSRAALPYSIVSLQCEIKDVQREIDAHCAASKKKSMNKSLKGDSLSIVDMLTNTVNSEEMWREFDSLPARHLREIEKYMTADSQGSTSALPSHGAIKTEIYKMISKEEMFGVPWSLLGKRMNLFVLFGWANLWDFGSEGPQNGSMADSYSEELQKMLDDLMVVRYPEAQVAAALATKWNVLVWGQNRVEAESQLRKTILDSQVAVEKMFPRNVVGILQDFLYADPFTDKEELPSNAILRKYDMVQGLEASTAVECFKAFEKLPPLILRWLAQTIKEEILGNLGTK